MPQPSDDAGQDILNAANRTLMVMAGGTGGHVYPALAVAHEMQSRGWEVFWLGTRNGLEARVVPEAGFDMVWLSMSGLRGNGVIRLFLTPIMLLRAFFQSLKTILARRPDVVLGMGGYTAFPGGMMASLLGKPLVIHEQNSIAGLTNRVLACLADRVLTAFPSAFKGEKDKPIPCRHVETRWVGNPVRAEIAHLVEEEHRYAGREGPFRLLVVGGSLGASALNALLPEALALIPAEQRPEVVHQSGRQHQDILKRNYEAVGVHADTRDFIDDMATLYEWCDLAVCRAGAMTIAELACAGVPAVLVPFPYAVDDHQTTNAKFLSEAGAAWLMQQNELSAEQLAALLSGLNRETLLEMSRRAQALAKPDAVKMVADVCEEAAA
jgi:UDP-N-acetylglucosamine--N-acetylmuramyl-(pentapeptide) pyrophosphoryl-undecaprenol N-acetylglucosamine transferase